MALSRQHFSARPVSLRQETTLSIKQLSIMTSISAVERRLGTPLASQNAATETTSTVFGKERGCAPQLCQVLTIRFHAFAELPYPLPNDQEEMSRLNSLHDLSKVLFHKNVLAPIQDSPGINILDLGTGSGFPLA
jgi:hypothetical protein